MNPELTILRFSPEFKEDPQTNKNTRMVYFSGTVSRQSAFVLSLEVGMLIFKRCKIGLYLIHLGNNSLSFLQGKRLGLLILPMVYSSRLRPFRMTATSSCIDLMGQFYHGGTTLVVCFRDEHYPRLINCYCIA